MISIETLRANGLTHRIARAGEGPLVLFCHGWPESWSSWREQITAVAAVGFTAVAADMRGYGGTDAPAAIERYAMPELVGDQVAIAMALGFSSAVIVGHDWGAPVAWHSALLRPDFFRAVVGMSVPWTPPAHIHLLEALSKQGIEDFYMQYFQTPGVAEAELERDVRSSLRRLYFSGSGDNRDRSVGFTRLGDRGVLGQTRDPDALPAWLSSDHLDELVATYEATGFRGGLNWYRNLVRNHQLMAPWRGQPILQPALFIAGEKDGVLKFPASKMQIEAYPRTLPNCRGVHILPGAGHWIQQERADDVSAILIDFLKGLG